MQLKRRHGTTGGLVAAAGCGTLAAEHRPLGARLGCEVWAAARSWYSGLRVLIVCVALILGVAFLHPSAYDFPTLRAAVETGMTLLALTGALLVRGQFLHSRRLRDLLLMAALVTLAVLELVANALPAALHLHSGSALSSVSPLGQLLVAAMFAAAAFTPADRVITGRHRPISAVAPFVVAGLLVAELAGVLLHDQLLAGSVHHIDGIGGLLARPVGVVVLLTTVGLFVYSAWAFAGQGRRQGDHVLTLLAGAAVVFAGARLYYLALPTVSPEAITYREGLRLIGFALILAAAIRQDVEIRRRTTRAAAIAERRRVAQDLHDGLAQDLAFIAAYGGQLAEDRGPEHPVAVAARRALAISRDAISELSDMSDTPPGVALEAIAQELGDRFEIAIAVNADPEADVAPTAREPVTRIVREAIANAARHGHAQHVVVSLAPTPTGTAVRVCDDGCGIRRTPAGHPPEGFGLRSIHERASALGGQMTIRERKAGGTELEVVLP